VLWRRAFERPPDARLLWEGRVDPGIFDNALSGVAWYVTAVVGIEVQAGVALGLIRWVAVGIGEYAADTARDGVGDKVSVGDGLVGGGLGLRVTTGVALAVNVAEGAADEIAVDAPLGVTTGVTLAVAVEEEEAAALDVGEGLGGSNVGLAEGVPLGVAERQPEASHTSPASQQTEAPASVQDIRPVGQQIFLAVSATVSLLQQLAGLVLAQP
jgi:hypothetical protein